MSSPAQRPRSHSSTVLRQEHPGGEVPAAQSRERPPKSSAGQCPAAQYSATSPQLNPNRATGEPQGAAAEPEMQSHSKAGLKTLEPRELYPELSSLVLPLGVADMLERRLRGFVNSETENPGGLAQIADLAFRAAVGQLEGGDFAESERCFRVALAACPASRTKAVAKIQTLLTHVQDQLQRTVV